MICREFSLSKCQYDRFAKKMVRLMNFRMVPRDENVIAATVFDNGLFTVI